MEEQQKQDLLRAIRVWVASHPDPDGPGITIMSSGNLSPRQIVEAIENDTENGRLLCRIFENAARAATWEEVLDSFRKSGEQPHPSLPS